MSRIKWRFSLQCEAWMQSFHTLTEIIETICSALGRKPPRLSLPVGPTRTLIRLIEKGSHAIGIYTNNIYDLLDQLGTAPLLISSRGPEKPVLV
jgi:hypothetical protein